MSEQQPEPGPTADAASDFDVDSSAEDDVPDAPSDPSDPSDPPAEPGEPLNPA